MFKPKKGEVRKPTKTLSGITPVAVMLPPRRCNHGMCVYCPSMDVPQSYTPKSPVVMRAMRVNYDSYKQVRARIKAFEVMNHPTDKIELIIMGGTFLEYPTKFQYEFILGLYNALNGKKSKTLEQAQKLNEKSKHRCVALCVETRPDVCVEFIDRMREWGVTRVELGVQIIDDEIYKKVKRGHTVQNVVDATRELKNVGFKVGYHIMPGLPGSNLAKDLKLFKKLFSDERFKPDQLKIYPCQVMPCSELENMYWAKKYKPYTREETEKILIEMMKAVPRYCRVMRVMREIPPDYIIAGTTRIDLRREIERELREKKIKLKEIRYREIGFAKGDVDKKLKLKVTKYKSSGGDEYFLEIVNSNDILFGLLRLRIASFRSDINGSQSTLSDCSLKKKSLKEKVPKGYEKLGTRFKVPMSLTTSQRSTLAKTGAEQSIMRDSEGKLAIIRELHVYGQALKLGQEGKISQHMGLGKWLMDEAEKICRREKIKELKIISGVGVREYYRKLGYELERGKGKCMVKKL